MGKSPKPYSAGRVVQYVPFTSDVFEGNNTSPLPAIIVNAWENNSVYQEDNRVNVQVFVDGPEGSHWRTSIPYDENKAPGTWHWPEIK